MSTLTTNLGTEPCQFCCSGSQMANRDLAKLRLWRGMVKLQEFLEQGIGTYDLRNAVSTAVDAIEAARRPDTAIGIGLHPGCSRCAHSGTQPRLELVLAEKLQEGDTVDLTGDEFYDPGGTRPYEFDSVEIIRVVPMDRAARADRAIVLYRYGDNGCEDALYVPPTHRFRVACPEALLCHYCSQPTCERHGQGDQINCGAFGPVHDECHQQGCPDRECWEDPDRAYEERKDRRAMGDD